MSRNSCIYQVMADVLSLHEKDTHLSVPEHQTTIFHQFNFISNTQLLITLLMFLEVQQEESTYLVLSCFLNVHLLSQNCYILNSGGLLVTVWFPHTSRGVKFPPPPCLCMKFTCSPCASGFLPQSRHMHGNLPGISKSVCDCVL